MKYWSVLKKTIKKYEIFDAMDYSSSIAFYLIFSLPAILVISISIAGAVYEDEVARTALIEQFETFFGAQSAEAIDKVLTNINEEHNSLLARIVGFITLIFSATTVFAALQDGINKVWGVKSKSEKSVYNFFKNRLISLAMAVSIGFLLLVTLVIDASLSLFDEQFISVYSEQKYYLAAGINLIISVVVTTTVFACLFKVIPEAEVKWKNVWMGAFITTFLFGVGKYLITFYLNTSSFGSVYGASGSLVVLLTWIFYSSMMVMFGAQFTAVYSEEIEGGIKPTENSVLIKEESQSS